MNKISFVTPLFNEQDSLAMLYQQLKSALVNSSLKSYNSEIIFINDGSTDNSLEMLKKIHEKNKSVKIISFRKNLGKSTALNEGFKKSEGDIIVTLDSDLQDGPENIPNLVNKLEEGYDLVVGWKQKRQDPWHKVLASKIFNFFVRISTGVPLHDFNCGLKVMTKEVTENIYLYGELHRFIPVLAAQKGFKVTEIPVVHHPRRLGVSKYGWGRLLKGCFDFLTVMFLGKFGERPLHFFGMLGGIGIFFGLIFGSYLSYLHFQGISIGRRPLLTLSELLILAGLQVLSIGLIAEMIVRKTNSADKLPIDYEI